MPELASGSRYGRFEIIERIGNGLTGTVYRAIDTKDPQRGEVALKLLETKDESVRAYFFNEMGLLRRASEHGRTHPHLVTFVASVTTQEPFALATRYYAGGRELSACLKEPLPPAQALRIVEQVAGALDYLHYGHPDAPVVHRDVKPGNILVNPRGDALLIDLSAATHQHFRLTNERSLGTPAYMPPEQYCGHEQPQTDLFALAMVAFQMLTRKTLLSPKPDPEGKQIAQLRDTGYARVRELLRTYPATAEVIIRAIAYEWQTRYASCSEFAYNLRLALARDGVSLTLHETSIQPQRQPGVNMGLIAMIAVTALAFVLLIGMVLAPSASSPSPERVQPTVSVQNSPTQPALEIRSPATDQPGLAPTSALAAPAAVASDVQTALDRVFPVGQGCALRDIPSTDGTIVRYSANAPFVPPTVALDVLERNGQWYRVRLPDGRSGWCPGYQIST
jgi:serine/threonine protein kinase